MSEKNVILYEVERLDYVNKNNRVVQGVSITFGYSPEKEMENHLGQIIDSAFINDISMFNKFIGLKFPMKATLRLEIKSMRYAPKVIDVII